MAVLVLAGCTPTPVDSFDRTPTLIPPKVLGTDVGADRYAAAFPKFAGVEQAPVDPWVEQGASIGATGAVATAPELLDEKRDISCDQAALTAVEYSAVNAQIDGSASIDAVIDTRLLQDWTGSERVPAAGEKVPLIKCWARVRWSVGAISDVDIWLLMDSDGNMRVRWDNIANIVQ